jgi:hypothetical protein
MQKTGVRGNVEVAPNVSLNVDLDAHDIVDIHVAMKEEELLKEEEKLLADLKVADQAVEDKDRELNKIITDLAKLKAKALESLVSSTLKAAGFTKIKIDASTNRNQNQDRIVLHLTTSGNPGGLTLSKPIKSSVVNKLRNQREVSMAEVKRIRDQLVKTKQAISNVDRMVRKARAQMALRVLESTSAGQAMLAGIKRDIVRALPAPKNG